MDSECPAASRIAGQEIVDSGSLFITAMWRTFKFGNKLLPNLNLLGVRGLAGHDDVSPGLGPYRHLADGDGR
ncbi:hypothetical protein [Halopelagius longus]|uniref:Uncharacterized protein n=1 Tax=Halopelagius longus TaxID=1236180 RepID=A0A1H1B9D8_9EURY|nr:hypothetical protein [Halopelagius longus]RDI70695.1 hypothetical protein DWB78_02555 [Halopelagius longus]SDQ48519.1 hypothetical protein SAMN05216278_1696 [Halopelagius longus]